VEQTAQTLEGSSASVQRLTSSLSAPQGIRLWLLQYWPECVTLAVYAALVAFAIPYHESFVDEAQSWQLARSLSLYDLFHTYLRYEGSPGLWHFTLWILIRLHVMYATIHWVCGAIGLVAVSLLVLKSPFPRYLKLAFPFTYFLLFQYAVIARNYVLAPLLFFLLALSWKRSPIAVALVLGLLANVSLHTAVISGGLAIVYLIAQTRDGAISSRIFRRQFTLAAPILLGFYAFAVWTVLPPKDLMLSRVIGESRPFVSIAIGSLLWAFCQPMVLSLLFWAAIVTCLSARKSLFYLLPVLLFALFSGGVYLNWWHDGLLIPLLICILWITWPAADVRLSRSEFVCRVALAVMICTQIFWSVYAIRYDHFQAYAPDLAASRFLRPFVQRGSTIAVTYLDERQTLSFESVGIQAYFDRSIYMNQQTPFWWRSENNRSEANFDALLPSHPEIIVVVTRRPHNSSPNVLSRNEIRRITDEGYRLTNTFCGAIPERFEVGDDSCRLIFRNASFQSRDE
jgi:hypothetical protein